MKTSPKANALSIDLEEWYHPYLIKKHVNSAKLDSIQEPTDALLTLLNKYETKATFFIVGEVAVKYPELIKKILPAWNPEARFEVIEGADHFYGGYLERLETVLDTYL